MIPTHKEKLTQVTSYFIIICLLVGFSGCDKKKELSEVQKIDKEAVNR